MRGDDRGDEPRGGRQREDVQGTQARDLQERRGSSSEIAPRGSGRGMSRSQSPFRLMSQLSREMDRVFEDFWRSPFGLMAPFGREVEGDEMESTFFAPAIEVHRHDGDLVVRVDLPGTAKEDVHVDLEGRNLVIQGERHQECQDDRRGHAHSEFRYGSFFRSIPLAENVDPKDVRAEFRDGVLEVHVPVPRQSESRKSIEVRGQDR